MKVLSGREFAKLLERNGWGLKRIHDSHNIYMKADRKERISVPVHGNKPLKRGLLTALLRIADLKDEK